MTLQLCLINVTCFIWVSRREFAHIVMEMIMECPECYANALFTRNYLGNCKSSLHCASCSDGANRYFAKWKFANIS